MEITVINIPITRFFLFSFFFLLCLSVSSVHGQEVDDESEFSYDHESDNGPEHWGEIKPEWSTCNAGKLQSPIDLMNERVEVVSELGRLHRDYKPSNATLMNRGHDMMLKWIDGAGYLHINGTSYMLNQVHWHSPSEHTINGRRFDLEVHLVHESQNGKVAVVGIVYKIGRTEPFLSKFEKDLIALAETKNIERSVGIVDPEWIKIGSRKYYRYVGSLTVPPCTQDVVWTIVRKVRTVTRAQVNLIREAVHDESETNARPVQPINKRSVKLYRPNDRGEN